MTETALDEFVNRARYYYKTWPKLQRLNADTLDVVCRMLRRNHTQTFFQTLQDPRYIQHCKEQDRKEGEEWLVSASEAIDAALKEMGYSRA